MSHQGADGPRNYVHRTMFDQMAKERNEALAEVRRLRAAAADWVTHAADLRLEIERLRRERAESPLTSK